MITYFYVRGKEKKMKSTKKKIVALSTAFVMAFALVAAMLPATVSQADLSEKYIHANGTVDNNGQGQDVIANIAPASTYDNVSGNEATKTITFNNLVIPSSGGIDGGLSYYSGDTYTFEFNGTNSMCFMISEGGGTLNVSVGENSTLTVGKVYPGITLAEGTTVSKDISGATPDNPVTDVTFSGPTGGGGSTESVPVKAGDNQTVTPGSPVVISFDKDFSKFENGGAVFLDDSTEPLSTDCYTATSGSTVITLLDSFTKTLPEGTHTLKVKFNDDSVGTASFIVSASANSAGSASGTSGTATSGTSSSAATTTKVAAPKTADVLPFAAIAVVFVGASVAGVTFIATRKNK